MPSGKSWSACVARALELTLLLLRSRESPREPSTRPATPPEAVRAEVHGSTIQELVKGVLEVQKGRMTLQLTLFAAAVTLTAAAFQFGKPVLFLFAGAVVPLALASDIMTKRNTLSPLLYKLAQLELEAGDPEPFALLFVAYDQKGFARFRSLLTRGADGKARQLFRRDFLWRDLPFRLIFYGVMLLIEVLAWRYWDWMRHLTP